jgi:hypothetical protein
MTNRAMVVLGILAALNVLGFGTGIGRLQAQEGTVDLGEQVIPSPQVMRALWRASSISHSSAAISEFSAASKSAIPSGGRSYSFAARPPNVDLSDEQVRALSAAFEKLAAELSNLLADEKWRKLLAQRFEASPRKSLIILKDYLGAALSQDPQEQSKRIVGLIADVQYTENTMQKWGIPPRIELKLPVPGYRELLSTSDTILVAVVPFADESEAKSITAYSKGARIDLGAKEAPRTPAVVLQPPETDTVDPVYPAPTYDQPKQEERASRRIDEFVGIPWINIADTSEGWTSGDPEIYVFVSTFKIVQNDITQIKVDLPIVKTPQNWYWLGDPNNTYRFLDFNVDRDYVVLDFYEEDRHSAHGEDDFLGRILITPSSLPFDVYTFMSTPETTNGIPNVRFGVDKD